MHVDALRKPHNALFLEERCDARDESVELMLVHAIVRRRGIGDDFLIIGLARGRAVQILVENEVAILAVTAQDVLQLVAEYEPEVVDPVQPQRQRHHGLLVRQPEAGAIDPGARNRLHHDKSHRSEEHTSELQSLMRIPYAVLRLKKETKYNNAYTIL